MSNWTPLPFSNVQQPMPVLNTLVTSVQANTRISIQNEQRGKKGAGGIPYFVDKGVLTIMNNDAIKVSPNIIGTSMASELVQTVILVHYMCRMMDHPKECLQVIHSWVESKQGSAVVILSCSNDTKSLMEDMIDSSVIMEAYVSARKYCLLLAHAMPPFMNDFYRSLKKKCGHLITKAALDIRIEDHIKLETLLNCYVPSAIEEVFIVTCNSLDLHEPSKSMNRKFSQILPESWRMRTTIAVENQLTVKQCNLELGTFLETIATARVLPMRCWRKGSLEHQGMFSVKDIPQRDAKKDKAFVKDWMTSKIPSEVFYCCNYQFALQWILEHLPPDVEIRCTELEFATLYRELHRQWLTSNSKGKIFGQDSSHLHYVPNQLKSRLEARERRNTKRYEKRKQKFLRKQEDKKLMTLL